MRKLFFLSENIKILFFKIKRSITKRHDEIEKYIKRQCKNYNDIITLDENDEMLKLKNVTIKNYKTKMKLNLRSETLNNVKNTITNI